MSDIIYFLKTYKSIMMGDIPSHIEQIQKELCVLLIDIQNAHFESALQAIVAYNKSGRHTELESAISHLRDVFNITKKTIYKEKECSHLFGIIKSSEPQFSFSEKITIILYLSYISKLIAQIYYKLEEKNNYLYWLKNSISLGSDLSKQFGANILLNKENFMHDFLNGEDNIFVHLYNKDKRYLSFEDIVEKYMSPSCAIHYIPRIKVTISSDGRNFLLDLLR